MKLFKKILKIISCVFLVLFIGLYIVFYIGTSPKSDEKVKNKLDDVSIESSLTYESFQGFKYRKIRIQHNDSLPTLVFVHGTIGSCLDFIEYMKDSLLLSKANIISYDRIGYNYKDTQNVQESIAFEAALLEDLTKNLNKENTILVGYSYGGPIVLATKEKYKKIIVLAPAIYSEVEPMPWAINLYKWGFTRWIIPPIWQQASKEKITHRKDLKSFENEWSKNSNKIISIHGDDDWIVPLSNSEFLERQFSEQQFELITIKGAGHSLVWSNFDFIKKQLLKQLN
jgi:pimeloyl-ACP methyl ester carboxylesterase